MFRFDKTRLDLAREFRARPFGEHSPDLQYLLNVMRRPSTEPFHILVVDKRGGHWTLASISPNGRQLPSLTDVVFTDIEEAEWYVFKLRWAALAGEPLPIE
jgi:N,N-dimethylformamidase